MNVLKLGGTSLKCAGQTGADDSDIATKIYIDRCFFPIDQPTLHYQRYIKARDYLMHPLTGLCKLTTNLSVSGKIHTLLESIAYHNSFYFTTQSVKGKFIQVDFLNSVDVTQWILMIDRYNILQASFKWQAKNDDDNEWIDKGNAVITTTRVPPATKSISVNTAQWNFGREGSSTGVLYDSWRLMGVDGMVSSSAYINIMLMYLL